MSTDKTKEDAENSKRQREEALALKTALENNTKAINYLADAISKQKNKQEQEETNAENIGERQIQEQKGANTHYGNANKISTKSMYINTGLLAATIIVLIWNIKSLNATEDQFNRTNDPTLDIVNTNLSFTKSGTIGCTIFIRNLGPHFVLGIGKADQVIFVDTKDTAAFIRNPFIYIDTLRFSIYTEEYYFNEPGQFRFPVSGDYDSLYRGMMSKRLWPYLLAYHVYNNPVTGNKRVYKSVIQFFPMNQKGNSDTSLAYVTYSFNWVRNNNYDLPN